MSVLVIALEMDNQFGYPNQIAQALELLEAELAEMDDYSAEAFLNPQPISGPKGNTPQEYKLKPVGAWMCVHDPETPEVAATMSLPAFKVAAATADNDPG